MSKFCYRFLFFMRRYTPFVQAEAFLDFVFTSSGDQVRIGHVVLFEHLARMPELFLDQSQPFFAQFVGGPMEIVISQPLINDPLQRCPAIGCVPLLAAAYRGG